MKIHYKSKFLLENLQINTIDFIQDDILDEPARLKNMNSLIRELYAHRLKYQLFIAQLKIQKEQIDFAKSNNGISFRTNQFFCGQIHDIGLLDFQSIDQSDLTEKEKFSVIEQWLAKLSEQEIDDLTGAAENSIVKIEAYASQLKLESRLTFNREQLIQLAQIYSDNKEIHRAEEQEQLNNTCLEMLDDKMVAHILGGAWAKDLELEGMDMSTALNYLEEYLRGAIGESSNEIIPTLKSDLERTKKLLNEIQSLIVVEDFSQGCHNLQDKLFKEIEETPEGLLIPGGWSGTNKTEYISEQSGHAMYYQVVKEGDFYTFRVFNAGAGTQFHAKELLEEGKEKYASCIEWQGLTAEEVRNPFLWQRLFEAKTLPLKHDRDFDRPRFNEDIIYQTLFHYLPEYKKKIPDNIKELDWITPQRIGNCAWKALMMFCRFKLGRDGYKSFIHDLKFHTTQNLYFNLQQGKKYEKNTWLMLKALEYSSEKLSKHLLNLINNKPSIELPDNLIDHTKKIMHIRAEALRLQEQYLKSNHGLLTQESNLINSIESLSRYNRILCTSCLS